MVCEVENIFFVFFRQIVDETRPLGKRKKYCRYVSTSWLLPQLFPGVLFPFPKRTHRKITVFLKVVETRFRLVAKGTPLSANDRMYQFPCVVIIVIIIFLWLPYVLFSLTALCQPGTFLKNMYCVPNCGPGFYGNTVSRECEKCAPNCRTCLDGDVPTKCSSCNSPLHIQGNDYLDGLPFRFL